MPLRNPKLGITFSFVDSPFGRNLTLVKSLYFVTAATGTGMALLKVA